MPQMENRGGVGDARGFVFPKWVKETQLVKL